MDSVVSDLSVQCRQVSFCSSDAIVVVPFVRNEKELIYPVSLFWLMRAKQSAVVAPQVNASSMTSAIAGMLTVGALGAASWNTALCEDTLPVYGKPGTNMERTFLAVKPDGVQVRMP